MTVTQWFKDREHVLVTRSSDRPGYSAYHVRIVKAQYQGMCRGLQLDQEFTATETYITNSIQLRFARARKEHG